MDDLGLDFQQGPKIFLFKMSIWALRPTQPPIEWVPGTHSADIKQLVYEANCSAEDENEWSYTSTPLICLGGTYKDNITLLYLNWQFSDMSRVITIC
jgi:hypothetical protein